MEKGGAIFNDVFGRVMRGPWGSYTATSWRIIKVFISILNDQLKKSLEARLKKVNSATFKIV